MPKAVIVTARRKKRRQSPYLLDGLANVTMAIGFRRLSRYYNGPVVRLRRAYDDRELDIWLKGDYLDGDVIRDFRAEGKVYTVMAYDHTGNGRHAFNPDPAAQPEFVPAVASLNGYPAMYGDGTPRWVYTTYDIPHAATLAIAYSEYQSGALYGGYMGGFFPRLDNNGWRPNSGGPPEIPFSDGDVVNNHNIFSCRWDYDTDIYQLWLGGLERIHETGLDYDYPLAGGLPGQIEFMATRHLGDLPLLGYFAEAILIEPLATVRDHNKIGQHFANTFALDWSNVA